MDKTPGEVAYRQYYAGFTVTPWHLLPTTSKSYWESQGCRQTDVDIRSALLKRIEELTAEVALLREIRSDLTDRNDELENMVCQNMKTYGRCPA